MNLGRMFNFLWIAVVVGILSKDLWVWLGFSVGQVVGTIFCLVIAGQLVAFSGLFKGLREGWSKRMNGAKQRAADE